MVPQYVRPLTRPTAAGCMPMPNVESASLRDPLPTGGYPAILAHCRVLGTPGVCRQVTDDCLGHLDGQLGATASGPDRRSARQTLREMADLLTASGLGLIHGDYQRLLGRLSRIFATDSVAEPRSSLTTMSPSYSGVVAAISRACPSCDYEAALGQLLIYMSRLFLDRHSGWKAVYRNIRSIAEGVENKGRLDDLELARIDEWVESGAANLFPIQRDLECALNRLGDQLDTLDEQIAHKLAGRELASRQRYSDASLQNVVPFDSWRNRRELANLKQQRANLCDQIDAKRGVKTLIDEDIRDLEESLGATRRAYFVHLAWSAS
jgi:uncharacterized protein YdcH (DUF465 family)